MTNCQPPISIAKHQTSNTNQKSQIRNKKSKTKNQKHLSCFEAALPAVILS
jgi:hypothetical protein